MSEASNSTTSGTGTERDAVAATPRAPRPATPRWLAIAIAAVFAVLYAYDMWEAVDSVVQLNSAAANFGVSLSAFAIVVLVVAIALPLIAYGFAFAIVRRRGPLAQLAGLFVGWCAVQAVSLSLAALLAFGLYDLG